MKLNCLLDGLDRIGRAPLSVSLSGVDVDIESLEYDSRRISRDKREIFACVKGERADGHDHARAAVEAGAVALLAEHEIDVSSVPVIVVPNVRGYMGFVSSVLYGEPSDKLKMFAVTGTNGKTTTSYIVRSLLRSSGIKAGMLGTIVYDDSTSEVPADRTTPEGADVQKMLSRMLLNGAEACVMEASSHGIHQGRIAGCTYDAMGFSNLTPEHLEYHVTMEEYYEAKRMLFLMYGKQSWRAAVNADDEHGARIIEEFGDSMMPYSLGAWKPGMMTASIKDQTIDGTLIEITFPSGRSSEIKIPFIGAYNVSNFLEAAGMVISVCLGEDDVLDGAASCSQVPGRLERYSLSNGASVFVDFAHSPDGVEKILLALRPMTRGKLRILWGAGGDRTKAKRPLTGEVMSRLADHSIITTDNPRSEHPADIARDVAAGSTTDAYEIILDRRDAIARILGMSSDGDVAVIAGKGPETEIRYADHSEHFSDSEEVLSWVKMHGLEVI